MSFEEDFEEAKGVCCQFWTFINNKAWDDARKMLSQEFEAYWPQTREIIVGPDNYIELNRRYPGEHKIELQNIFGELDKWELVYTISTQVRITSKMPDGKDVLLFGISFFELDSEK